MKIHATDVGHRRRMFPPRDHWIVGLDGMMPEVSGSSCPSARLHSPGIPAPHRHPSRESFHGKMRMILADPADAETIGALEFYRGSEARGPCSKHRRNTARQDNGLWDMGRIRETRKNPSRSRVPWTRPGQPE